MSSNNKITILGNALSKISFCDKQCSNINDNNAKRKIIEYLDSKYNIQVISREYNIITINTLRIVSFYQHILTSFTNGNPYLLYLTIIDGINCCIYIDKKLKDGYTFPKMHCVKYAFNNDLFKNDTLFSGELIKDNERRWFFIIDNILLYKGIKTTDKNIISRFELIHKILNNEYTQTDTEICPLQIKKLFLYKDIEKLVNEFIPNLSYTCKGIIFYTLNNSCTNFAFLIPRDSPFEIKTSNEIHEIIQHKYPNLWTQTHSINKEYITDSLPSNIYQNNSNNEQQYITPHNNDDMSLADNTMITSINSLENVNIEYNNVVFKILKTDIPDIYNLYCIDENNNLYKHSIAAVPNIKISTILYNTFKSDPNNLKMKVECKYSKIFTKWIPIRFVNNEPYTKSTIDNIERTLVQND